MVIRKLVTSWGLKVDDKKLKAWEQGIRVAKWEVGLLVAGVTALKTAMWALAVNTSKNAEAIKLASDRIGIGTDALQGYQYAGRLVNMETEEINGGLQRFIKFAAKAAEGSEEQTEQFKRMGLSVRDANGNLKSTDALLQDTAEWFNNAKNAGAKMAAGMAMFGRGSANFINMFAGGRAGLRARLDEAKALGVIMTPTQIKRADEFRESWEKILEAVIGFKNYLGSEVITELKPVVEKMVEWWKTHQLVVKADLKRYVSDLVNMRGALGWVVRGFEALAIVMASFAIGKAAYGLISLVASLKAGTAAAALLNIEVTAIVLAIAVLVVMIEDFASWIKGEDSLLGDFLSKAKEFADTMGLGAKTSYALAGGYEQDNRSPLQRAFDSDKDRGTRETIQNLHQINIGVYRDRTTATVESGDSEGGKSKASKVQIHDTLNAGLR